MRCYDIKDDFDDIRRYKRPCCYILLLVGLTCAGSAQHFTRWNLRPPEGKTTVICDQRVDRLASNAFGWLKTFDLTCQTNIFVAHVYHRGNGMLANSLPLRLLNGQKQNGSLFTPPTIWWHHQDHHLIKQRSKPGLAWVCSLQTPQSVWPN